MSTFLALVNEVIAESKQVLDPLTSANFADPPRTVLYNRIKGWVNQSYLDLLEERREWFFTSERGVVTIQPRLHLAKINPLYTPQVGDVLTGDTSGVSFVITEVFTDSEGASYTDEATVGVLYDDETSADELVQWETVTANDGVDEFLLAARIENRGTYNLAQYIPTIDSINQNSITLKKSVLDPEFDANKSSQMYTLRYVDWPQFLRHYENFYAGLAQPTYVSTAPNGDLQFFPYPDGLYDVAFEYEQKGNPLVNWDDVPELLPAKHHKILVWKALIELADFNNDRVLYARANKKYLERLGWLMRDYLPEMKFGISRFFR